MLHLDVKLRRFELFYDGLLRMSGGYYAWSSLVALM